MQRELAKREALEKDIEAFARKKVKEVAENNPDIMAGFPQKWARHMSQPISKNNTIPLDLIKSTPGLKGLEWFPSFENFSKQTLSPSKRDRDILRNVQLTEMAFFASKAAGLGLSLGFFIATSGIAGVAASGTLAGAAVVGALTAVPFGLLSIEPYHQYSGSKPVGAKSSDPPLEITVSSPWDLFFKIVAHFTWGQGRPVCLNLNELDVTEFVPDELIV